MNSTALTEITAEASLGFSSSLARQVLAPWAQSALPLMGADGVRLDWDGCSTAILDASGRMRSMETSEASPNSWCDIPLWDGGRRRGELHLCAPPEVAPRLRDALAELLGQRLVIWTQCHALQAQVSHNEMATDAARVGLWEWEPDNGTSRSHQDWTRLFGYAPGEVEVSYEGWASLVHADDLAEIEKQLQDFLCNEGQNFLRLEYRMRHAEGNWRWTLSLASVIRRHADGRPSLVAGTHQDIHIEKSAEMAVKESERYSRELFDSSPDCIKVIALDGDVLDISRHGMNLLGLGSREELVGKKWHSLWEEPYRSSVAAAFASAGEGRTSRFRGHRPSTNGSPSWWDIFVAPLRNAQGLIDRTLVTSRDITAQVEAEERLHNVASHVQAEVVKRTAELREGESRLRSILSNIDGMACRWRYDDQQTLLFVSDGCLQVLGIEPSRLNTAHDLLKHWVHSGDRARVKKTWESIHDHTHCGHDFRIVRSDGEIRWVHERLSAVRDGNGALTYVDSVITDITQKRDMYRSLTLANHTLEESLVSVFWMDGEGRGLRANRATSKLLGYEPEELIRLDLTQVHPDFAPKQWQRVCRRIRKHGPQQIHLSVRHQSRREIPVIVFLTRVVYEGKEIYVGFATDESGRVAAEQERRDSELLSRAALGSLSSRIAIMDRHGKVLATNKAWKGQSQDQHGIFDVPVGGLYLQQLTKSSHQAAPPILHHMRAVLDHGAKSADFQYLLDDSGPRVWMHMRVSRFGSGEDLRIVAQHEDISDHKRIQQDLEDSRNLFETLCVTAPVVIYHADGEGRCRYISDQWRELTGRDPTSDLGHGWMRVIHPEDRQAFRAAWEAVKEAKESFETEARILHADGREMNAYFQAISLPDSDGGEDSSRWIGTITDLTEINRANRKLARAEAMQRQVLQALPAVVYVLRPTHDETLVEPVWLSSSATSKDYLDDGKMPSGSWWAEHVHPDDFNRVMGAFQVHLKKDSRWSYEYRLRRTDGSYAWVADHIQAVRDEHGNLIEIIGSLNDVSDRYAAEAAFRESEARVQAAFEQAAVGMAQIERGVLVRPNRRLWEMIGGIQGQDPPRWSVLTHPEDRERDASLLTALRDGKVASGSLDKRLITFDARVIWVHVTYSVIASEGRAEGSVFAVVEDISERRRIQGAANQALSTLDAIAEATFSFAPDDVTFFYVNAGALNQTGYSRPELVTMSLLDLQSPEDADHFSELLEAAIRQPGSAQRLETKVCRKGGTKVPVEVALRYISEEGEPPYFVAVARDISDRLHAQRRLEELNAELEARVTQRTDDLRASNQLLRNKEEQIRAIVDNIPSCVVTFDCDGVIVSTNAAIQDVFGVTATGAIGRSIEGLVPHLLEATLGMAVPVQRPSSPESAANGSLIFKGAFGGMHADGKRVDLEVSVGAFALHGETNYAAIIRDVREELEAKRELLRARAAAEQGSHAKSAFLATMSHEIRTPMNAVLGMSELLIHRPLSRADREMVETIQHSAATLLDLIDDLLDFSKIEAGKLELAPHPIEMDRMMEAVCATHIVMAQDRRVVLQATVGPDVPVVHADPVRIRQILHNLIGNAIKFSGGRETVEGRVDVNLAALRLANGAQRLTLTICDNGIGMDEDTIRRVFTPFTQAESSTTRRFGGTGLGLSICKRLVDLMGGQIRCHSTPGAGTTFEVVLTFAPGQWSHDEPSLRFPDGSDVVVVSADPVFQQAMRTYLSVAKQPHESLDSPEALVSWLAKCDPERLAANEGSIVLITDIATTDGWRDIEAKAGDILGFPPLQIAWLQGSCQSPSLVESGVVITGRATLTLPRLERAARRLRQTPRIDEPVDQDESGALESFGKVRLLVAEDHEINQRVILHQLRRLGLSAEVVGDGVTALERWREGQYAIVLADLHMPAMDGYSLARMIRSEEAKRGLPRTPIIAFTANAVMGEDARCFEAGMDDVITKPAKLDRLRAVMRQWLEYRGQIAAASRAPSMPISDADLSADRLLNLDILKELVGDEPATLIEFLGEFLGSGEQLMHAMRQSAPTLNWRDVSGPAHRLKSSARSVGASVLGQLSELIEEIGRSSETTQDSLGEQFEHLEDMWRKVSAAVRGRVAAMEDSQRD